MSRILLDPHWRRMDELFSPAARARLEAETSPLWGRDRKAPEEVVAGALGGIDALVAAKPEVDAALLERAPRLRAVIEVSGAFPDTIDYAACAARGVEVLSCAPGFARPVAEMALAMILSGARGLVAEHEAFRAGSERWLSDNESTDFSLHGTALGFVGYGGIAREIHRLAAPFAPRVRAFDPWARAAGGVEFASLEEVARESRVLVVAASPTRANKGLVGREVIALMPRGALAIVISRAHLVDFPALLEAVEEGRVRACLDVFPSEPVAPDDPARRMPGLVLSPHRAASVPGGRHAIGDMILDDLAAMREGRPERRLQRADPARVADLAGVGDAAPGAGGAPRRAAPPPTRRRTGPAPSP